MRGGLLGQASVLTATSYPEPHLAGAARQVAARHVLGSPPPPPPPDVPSLERGERRTRAATHARADGGAPPATRRARPATCGWIRSASRSRSSTRSASGAWRRRAGPSTPRRPCPTARDFDGIAGLRAFLAGHREDFVRTFTEKLLAYALGRGLEPADMPAVRGIVRARRAGQYRWSSIVVGIVQSVPFRMASASAARRDATAGRRAAAVIRKGSSMIVLRRGDSPADGAARARRVAGAAAARRHDARRSPRAAQTARGARPPLRRGLRAERHGDGELPAGHRGRVVRADPDAAGAGAVPIADDRAERPELRAVAGPARAARTPRPPRAT